MPQFQPETAKSISQGTVALLGIPWDKSSTYMRGPAQAPDKVREQLYGCSANLWTESGIDMGDREDFTDLVDLTLGADTDALMAVEKGAPQLLERGIRLHSIGGDH